MISMRFATASTASLALVSGAALLATSMTVGFSRAEPGRNEALRATATCDRIAGPGRVKCEAEVVAPSGSTVLWADAVVVETPAFVSALKGRIGPADTTARDKEKWRFTFGLVARARGTGDVKLNVRAVVCSPSLS